MTIIRPCIREGGWAGKETRDLLAQIIDGADNG